MREDYAKARRAGEKTRRHALSRGEYPYPVTLDTIALDFDRLPKIPCGVCEVPLRLIAGSVTAGRKNAFARDFMPILDEDTEFAMKWSALLDSQESEGIREPAKIYEYMNRFYVLEGNKRVSVLKYVGAFSIPAEVTRVMPKVSDSKEYRVYSEFLKFYQVTSQFEPVFSELGSYGKLAARYGESLETPWQQSSIEAVRSDFRAFLSVYLSGAVRNAGLIPGDAFLLYLNFYPESSPLLDARSVTEKQLASIKDELESVARAAYVARIEDLPARRKSYIPGLPIRRKPVYSKEHPLKCVFIYASTPEASRRTYGHELGRLDVESHFDGLVSTSYIEGCSSDEVLDAALENAAGTNADVIFTTSATMMDTSMRFAVRYPKIRFMNCSINLLSSRVRTYYPKMYEAKLLMGALTASLSDTHRIGYLAESPVYGSAADINAFAIGAALVDPKCRIVLKWSGLEGGAWEKEFEDEGISLISGPDFIRPKDASRKYGIYHKSRDEYGNEVIRNIAAPIFNWGNYYTRIITSILDGSFEEREHVDKATALNYWYGIPAGVIDIIFSDELPYYSRKLVGLLKDGILQGAVTPFRGEIHSQEGMRQAEGAPALSGNEIITMDWLNDNVDGRIPAVSELAPGFRDTCLKMGVGQ